MGEWVRIVGWSVVSALMSQRALLLFASPFPSLHIPTPPASHPGQGCKQVKSRKGDGQRVTVLIPPGRGAQPSSSRSPGQRERNRNIRTVRKLGREEWYATSGYSRRSLVENTVFRYKTVFGTVMRSRSLVGQRMEASLACKILNTMTGLGMPDSIRVR